MPVSDKHIEYIESLDKWTLVSDCVKGSQAIKTGGRARTKGDKYLPIPNASDKSLANIERYKAYVARANFVGFTGHTKKGMTGMVFRKDTVLDLPEAIEYIRKNANGGGLSLEHLIKDILGETLEKGRYGLLVDYPSAESNLTKAQVDSLNLRANILPYKAEKIINWRTEIVGAISKLSLVVLEEVHDVISEDGFSVTPEIYHRVLKLSDGLYTQELYNEDDELINSFEPKKSDGSRWDEIPFIFVGAENNDETVDDAPLYDMAEVNLAHYRNSADYEESCFIVGQPTPVIAGLTQGWVNEVLKGSVQLGSRAAIPLPEGGSAMLLQANPNQMPLEGMKTKEEQMLMIGARLIQDNGGQETAEAAKIRFAGQNSDLSSIVGNIEEALIACCNWALMYMGGNGEVELEINRHFYDSHLDAQQVMALIQLADRGDISSKDIRATLRKSGLIDSERTDDEIDLDIGESGAGLMLDSAQPQQSNEINPQLLEILNKLTEVKAQEYIPAESGAQGELFSQPQITVEAPIVNVTLPEGLIQLPENMVTVTVESPEITIEGSHAAPLTVNNQTSDKDIKLVYNSEGKAVGAESRAVES